MCSDVWISRAFPCGAKSSARTYCRAHASLHLSCTWSFCGRGFVFWGVRLWSRKPWPQARLVRSGTSLRCSVGMFPGGARKDPRCSEENPVLGVLFDLTAAHAGVLSRSQPCAEYLSGCEAQGVSFRRR